MVCTNRFGGSWGLILCETLQVVTICVAFDGQRKMAFASCVVAGVADVVRALVFELEPCGVERHCEAARHFGGDRGGGS